MTVPEVPPPEAPEVPEAPAAAPQVSPSSSPAAAPQVLAKKGLIGTMVRHPNASNLLMAIIVIAGMWAGQRLNVQFFPTVDVPVVVVVTPWAGASAEDVDANITAALEPAVRFLDNVVKVTSISREGYSAITLEYLPGADMQRATGEVEAAVAQVTTLPEDAESPTISRAAFYDRVASILVSGPFEEASLKAFSKLIRDDLLDAGADRVTLAGARDEEIVIEVPERELRRLNLTLPAISQKIAASSRNQPLGSLRGEVERLLRSDARKDTARDFARVEIKSLSSGEKIYLRDIAVVRDTFADGPEGFDSQARAIAIHIDRSAGSNLLDISNLTRARLDVLRDQMPPSLSLELYNVRADLVLQRILMLTRNAAQGLVLVLVMLFLFLSWRIAGWVAAGVATSILGALVAMLVGGESINMLSLFSMLLMIGIVVDDAIVVGEHAVALYERGMEPYEAAEQATYRMAPPVLASSLTTAAAFAPVFLIGDIIGEFMHTFATVALLILVASLVECFLILPSHCAHALAKQSRSNAKPSAFNRAFATFRDGAFRRFVTYAYDRRYPMIMLMIGALVIVGGLVAGGRVPVRFFPSPEAEIINADLTFVPGTPRERTMEGLRALELALRNVETTLGEGAPLVKTVFAQLGRAGGARNDAPAFSDNYATLFVELTPSETREVRTDAIVRAWRKAAPKIAGLERVIIAARRGGPPGEDLAVRVSGKDTNALKAASLDIQSRMTRYPGVLDISDNLPYGKREVALTLTPRGAALGFTADDLAQQLRANHEGVIARRFARGDEEVAVRVRLPRNDKALPLASLHLRSPISGEATPLLEVVHTSERIGFAAIRRQDGARTITISASVDPAVAAGEDIGPVFAQENFAEVALAYNVTLALGGRSEEQGAAFGDLQTGMLLALAMIYAILAIALGNYVQPIIVMTLIPFGIIGAVIGHMVMGYALTILTMIALLGLTGVVVNDSIILVSEVNALRKNAPNARDAIIQGSVNRLRAVILTSATTIVGLVPLLFERSLQAQFLKPMAITLSWGVAFATVIVLALVPCMLGVVEDGRALFSRRKVSPSQPAARPPPQHG